MARQKPFILLPLYIYPTTTSWEPLFSAAKSHRELDFYVVVNPANGPGPQAVPDANYLAALGQLSALPNTKTIGYVHCNYGNRLIEDIVKELYAYRGWHYESRRRDGCQPIHVDGIFIDECPSSTQFVQYMADLATAAKTILANGHDQERNGDLASPPERGAADGEEKPEEASAATAEQITPSPPSSSPFPRPVVIYNPGVVIDPIFYQAADYVVAFEDASRQWNSDPVRRGLERLPKSVRERTVALVHSSKDLTETGRLSAQAVASGMPGQFVTTVPGYTEWCPDWEAYIQDIARRD